MSIHRIRIVRASHDVGVSWALAHASWCPNTHPGDGSLCSRETDLEGYALLTAVGGSKLGARITS